jgi:amino acid transporter
VGFLLTMYTQTGYDASAHAAEETRGASIAAAKGVVNSVLVSAIAGWVLILAFTFAIQDLGKVADAGAFASIEVLQQALSKTGAELLLAIAVGGQLFCGMSAITSASRMLYAFSRDRATPGHQLWRRLNAERVPYMAAIAIAVLAFLAAFPAYFGTNGYVAYAAVTSVATIGLYIAYAIPIYLRLRAGDSWQPGAWNLGRWYKLVGWTAVVWVAFISILFILPTNPGGVPWHTDKFKWTLFNYAPVAVIGTVALVAGWWLLSARRWFVGPVAQGTEEELAAIEARYGEGGAPPATTPAT